MPSRTRWRAGRRSRGPHDLEFQSGPLGSWERLRRAPLRQLLSFRRNLEGRATGRYSGGAGPGAGEAQLGRTKRFSLERRLLGSVSRRELTMVHNPNEIEECIRVLEALVSDPARLAA